MGVRFRVIAHGTPKGDWETLDRKVRERVELIDARLSDYRKESEINRLCKTAPHDRPQPVSADLATVLSVARRVYGETDGAFDVTIGPLSQLWRMARKRNRLPAGSAMAQARLRVGMGGVRLADPDSVQCLRPDLQLDFGGIAKGYAADQIVVLLEEEGIGNCLVDASGDIRVAGHPPGKPDWLVAVADGRRGTVRKRIRLRDGAVATSGDLYQALVIDGQRYSHIIDPRTGWPTTTIAAVTVMAPDATRADAYASALAVLGPDAGLTFVEQRPELAVRFVVRSANGEPRVLTSNNWPDD